MKRLREEIGSPDPDREFMARLVSSARSYEPDDARRTRVRARIVARPSVQPRWMLRAATTIVVIAIAAAAAASVVRLVRERNASNSTKPATPSVAPPAVTASPIAATKQPTTEAPIKVEHVSAPPVVMPTTSPPPVVASATDARSTADKSTPAHERRSTNRLVAHAPSTANAGGDEWRVARALGEIKAGKDPGPAMAELADYLKRHPDGLLAEEALAVSIAVAARHDDPKAGSLAAHYLARYPSGRWVEVAHRTLARFPVEP